MKNIGPALKKIKWKHYVNYVIVLAALIVLVIAGASGGLKASTNELVLKIAISIVLAVSLSIVVGFLGELSLGHAGFMCVGAYIGGKVAVVISEKLGSGLLTFLISLVVGGLCAAVCGFIIGLPALRLRGDYLAIVTLAFGEIVKVIFQQSKTFGANLGFDTLRYDKSFRQNFYIIALILVLITLAVTENMIRSKHGRAITAIRDNEIAAKACGVDVTKYKLIAFVVSAFFAGIAGVMFSCTFSTVQAPKFGYNYSIEILVMVVLGGMGNITGTILSASLITFLNVKLSTVLTGDLAVVKDLVYALILVLIVIYTNAPAFKTFREKHNLKAFTLRFFKPKKDPSRIRDDEAKWSNIPTKINMDELLTVDLKVQESVQSPDKGGKDK